MLNHKTYQSIFLKSILVLFSFVFIGQIKAQINNGTNTLSNNSSSTGNNNTGSGLYSFSIGMGNVVSSEYSVALGTWNGVSGFRSFAVGHGSTITSGGSYSFASGIAQSISGAYATAMGRQQTVSGAYGFAVGYYNTVSGSYSSALGYYNTLSGSYSSALGYNNNVSGSYSFAAPYGAKAQNTASVGLGYYADANANYSVAIGHNSKTTGLSSISLGLYAEATGIYSIAQGTYVKTSNLSSITIGSGVNSGSKLDNGIENSLMVGFNSTIPTFFVGASSGSGTTGNVGIANSTPQAKFHLTGNAGSLLLEGTDKVFMTFYPLGYGSGRKGFFGFSDSLGIDMTLKNEISGGDINIITTDSGTINLNGSVWAKEVVVQLTDPWPDYVFTKEYKRYSLKQLDEYIAINKHLPNVPSAKEISKKGINLAEMDAILLEKIEELTLYTIEQQKLIEKQGELINELVKTKK